MCIDAMIQEEKKFKEDQEKKIKEDEEKAKKAAFWGNLCN